jgi:hypothetical protein
MDIVPANGESAAAATERPAPRDASMRWLRELERAQWALRGQRPAASGSAAGARPETDAASTPAAPHGSSREEVGFSPAAAKARQSTTASRDSPGKETGFLKNSEEVHLPQNPLAQGRGTINERKAALRPAVRPAAPQPAPSRTSWPRINVHAYRGEQALDVWVRDGLLDEAARRRLAAELRTHMAAKGLRLGALVVNGETIIPVDPVGADPGDEPTA